MPDINPVNGGRKKVKAPRGLKGEQPIKKDMEVEGKKGTRVPQQAEEKGKDLMKRKLEEANVEEPQAWAKWGTSLWERQTKRVRVAVETTVGGPKAAFDYIVGPTIRAMGYVAYNAVSLAPGAYKTFMDMASIMELMHEGEMSEEIEESIASDAERFRGYIEDVSSKIAGNYNWGADLADRNAKMVTVYFQKVLGSEVERIMKAHPKKLGFLIVKTLIQATLLKVFGPIDDTLLKVLTFEIVTVFKQVYASQAIDLDKLIDKNKEKLQKVIVMSSFAGTPAVEGAVIPGFRVTEPNVTGIMPGMVSNSLGKQHKFEKLLLNSQMSGTEDVTRVIEMMIDSVVKPVYAKPLKESFFKKSK